jgi:hypothetical protein
MERKSDLEIKVKELIRNIKLLQEVNAKLIDLNNWATKELDTWVTRSNN